MNHLTMQIRSEKSVTRQFRQATILEALPPIRLWGANLGHGGQPSLPGYEPARHVKYGML